MSNIFIKETKNFYNYYVTSTHCKHIKQHLEEYDSFVDSFFNRKKKKIYLQELRENLNAEQYINIRNYIFKKSAPEDEFVDWMKLIKDFSDFVYEYGDPLFINVNGFTASVTRDKSVITIFISNEIFDFNVKFEKSKINKNLSSSTLFDSITGLDKINSNINFINIDIINKNSNKDYHYKYMDDGELIIDEDYDEIVCDIQLNYVKFILCNYIMQYVSILFDNIIHNEIHRDINLFYDMTTNFEKSEYKEIYNIWLKNKENNDK